MILWLDDLRDPAQHGWIGAVWAKTAEEAVSWLATGEVEMASLDHDLTIDDTMGTPKGALTGYDVILYMERNNIWPPRGTFVHSMNPSGRQRMQQVIDAHYRR